MGTELFSRFSPEVKQCARAQRAQASSGLFAALPHTVLVDIMQRVDLRSLLVCALSKRSSINAIVLKPDVWRRVEVSALGIGPDLVGALHASSV